MRLAFIAATVMVFLLVACDCNCPTEPAPGTGKEDTVVEFPGGLYAVARVPRISEPYYEQIFPTWQRLGAWIEESPYHAGSHQWLEQHLRTEDVPDDWTIDCYMPIAE